MIRQWVLIISTFHCKAAQKNWLHYSLFFVKRTLIATPTIAMDESEYFVTNTLRSKAKQLALLFLNSVIKVVFRGEWCRLYAEYCFQFDFLMPAAIDGAFEQLDLEWH